jgi:putative oxidoreductase
VSSNLIILIARVLLVIMFLTAGVFKFINPASTVGMLTQAGFPAPTVLNILAGIFEIVASIAVLIGYRTRIAAYALAAFCVITASIFHSGPINIPSFSEGANGMLTTFNFLILQKNLAVAGGFLLLAVLGPGGWSVDAKRA